jgi:peptidyl-prolyl cis-trans isomerase A (cyclophilin A)
MKPSLLLTALLVTTVAGRTTPAVAEEKEKPAAPAPPAAAAPATVSLTDPSKLTEKAPESFKVKVTTTKGDFTIEVTRAWSPNGADRFYNLVKAGFFSDLAFFRAISGFMIQFGIHGDPAISTVWRDAKIPDDKGGAASNTEGMVTFATAGPNTRTTQFFINLANNARLDSMGFTPFGKVVEGMDVVKKFNTEYGEGAPQGRGPHQGKVQMMGNPYLKKEFPNLDYIKSAELLK